MDIRAATSYGTAGRDARGVYDMGWLKSGLDGVGERCRQRVGKRGREQRS